MMMTMAENRRRRQGNKSNAARTGEGECDDDGGGECDGDDGDDGDEECDGNDGSDNGDGECDGDDGDGKAMAQTTATTTLHLSHQQGRPVIAQNTCRVTGSQ